MRFFKSVLGSSKRSAKSRRQLGLEALEDRLCLSMSPPTLSAGVLTIQCNSANDYVSIMQDDSANTLEVSEVGPGGSTYSFTSSQVQKVVIKMGGGNDQLDYRLGSDFTNAKVIKVDLGGGDDKARFHFNHAKNMYPGPIWSLDANLTIKVGVQDSDIGSPNNTGKDEVYANIGTVEAGREVKCTARLGDGNDVFRGALYSRIDGLMAFDIEGQGGQDNFKVGDETFVYGIGTPGVTDRVTVADAATLEIKLNGGGNTDTIAVNYFGLLQGTLKIDAQGGGNADTVYGLVEAWSSAIYPDLQSDGVLDAKFSGNNGDDFVDFWLGGDLSDLNITKAEIDGGDGADFWHWNWNMGMPASWMKIPGTSTPNVTKTSMSGAIIV